MLSDFTGGNCEKTESFEIYENRPEYSHACSGTEQADSY